MSISNRVKEVRKLSKLSQAAFGEKLGVSRDVINDVENDRVTPKDLLIKHLCSVFNVNEEWLRDGSGEMYTETKSDFMSLIARRFKLDGVDVNIISMYFEMPLEYRKLFRVYLESLVNTAYQEYKKKHPDKKSNSVLDTEIEEEVESYRRELELEKRAEEKSSALDGTKEA